jgi:hypothetical protein
MYVYINIYNCIFLSILHIALLYYVRENNSLKIYNILLYYIQFIKTSLLIHNMTSDYASSFVESSSSSSSAEIASVALIRNDQDNELILWSKKMKNKNEMNKAQKEFKQWWYFTSYEIKNVNLTTENKLHHMRWEEINRSSENWQYFIECARAKNETSRLLCRRCEDDLIHSTSTREEISAIKNHRKKKDCFTRETNKYPHTSVIKLTNKISRTFFS